MVTLFGRAKLIAEVTLSLPYTNLDSDLAGLNEKTLCSVFELMQPSLPDELVEWSVYINDDKRVIVPTSVVMTTDGLNKVSSPVRSSSIALIHRSAKSRSLSIYHHRFVSILHQFLNSCGWKKRRAKLCKQVILAVVKLDP